VSSLEHAMWLFVHTVAIVMVVSVVVLERHGGVVVVSRRARYVMIYLLFLRLWDQI
jgi:uncharacterized protein YlbG (UPF0298 family)